MYFVQGAGNLLDKICDVLQEYFGDKAEVRGWCDGKLYVKVKDDAGFKDKHKRLSEEEIKMGVMGGGTVLGLDGKTFCIRVEEIKDYPWVKE
jgi:hypothetical protein